MEQIHFAAVFALRYMRLYADARSNLHMRMCTSGYAHLIACIMWITRMNMKPYISGSSESVFNLFFIDCADDKPGKDWSWVRRFLRMRSPLSFMVHCSCILSGAQAPPTICFAEASVMGRA